MTIDLLFILPIIILVVTGMSVLLLDLFLSDQQRDMSPKGDENLYLSLLGVALAVVATNWQSGIDEHSTTLANMVIFDAFGLTMQWLLLVITAFALVFSHHYLKQHNLLRGEYYTLMLFVAVGGLIMVTANDLIAIFLGLELLSLALYVLAAFARERPSSGEAGMKYLLLGGFASAFLLYGIALIFGASGTTNLNGIADSMAQWTTARAAATAAHVAADPLPLVGLGLLLVGFGFKIAAAPFHSWVPDVYEGAPTPVTAFMSAATKVASFAALIRILFVAFGDLRIDWGNALAMLAILTMTVGNVAALMQTNIKRLLAYSGIAHAGYILVALVAGTSAGLGAAVFYLIVYSFMNLGAWMVVLALGDKGVERLNVDDFAGLHARQPLLALAMAVFMLALAGMPPTGGLMGKWLVFSAAIQENLLPLALIGVLNSVVSLGYYLRVVTIMYTRPPDPAFKLAPIAPALQAAIVLALIGVLLLGLWPTPFLEFLQGLSLASLR
jgi:NADH-quinone oxidoreductase subunit N